MIHIEIILLLLQTAYDGSVSNPHKENSTAAADRLRGICQWSIWRQFYCCYILLMMDLSVVHMETILLLLQTAYNGSVSGPYGDNSTTATYCL